VKVKVLVDVVKEVVIDDDGGGDDGDDDGHSMKVRAWVLQNSNCSFQVVAVTLAD
jgi:hypothetical protein